MAIGSNVPEEIRCYLASLQKDGRLLLRHLIRRSNSTLPDIVPVGVASDGTPSDALFAEPQTIATDAAKIAELVANVDLFSRRAAPANVRSIRLTYAYLNMSIEGGEPPADIEKEVRSIRRYMLGIIVIALIVFFLSVGLLAHADHGHRLLQQLDDLNQRSNALRSELVSVPLNEFALEQATGPTPLKPESTSPAADNLARGPFCNNGVSANAPTVPANAATSSPTSQWRRPLSAKAIDLCRQHDDLNVRFDLIYTELAGWNCATRDIIYPWKAVRDWIDPDAKRSCGDPAVTLPHEVDDLNWKSYDTRAKVSIAMMTGFVLPMMLGCLGGCAYAFRRLDTKLSTWTLEPQDGKHALARVFLATLLGGLVGVVWTSDQPVTLGGFTLSLAATAFFVGFSVEAVFRLIQSLIDTVTSGIRTPVPTQAAAPETLSVAQIRRIANESVTESGRTKNERDLSLGTITPVYSQQSPPESEKARQIIALVEKAAALIDSKGKSVFAEFRKSDSEWRSGDTYLFAGNMNGMSLLNAEFPKQEGTDIGGLTDAKGKLIGVELMKTAQSKGSGWVDCMFPKPGQTQPSRKWSYVKAVKIDGTPGYVGAGCYPE